MPTKLPDDFMVTESIKDWSYKKYGWYDLPDFFISDFRKHHAAKGTRMENWEKGLMNWIDWSSPSGRFYNADNWDNAIQYCKEVINREKPTIEVPVKKTPIKRDRAKGIAALQRLRQMVASEDSQEPERNKRKTPTMPDEIAEKQRQALINNPEQFKVKDEP